MFAKKQPLIAPRAERSDASGKMARAMRAQRVEIKEEQLRGVDVRQNSAPNALALGELTRANGLARRLILPF